MTRRSRRLRNCKIVNTNSQNEATQEQQLEQEQQPSQGQQSVSSSQANIDHEVPSNSEQQSDAQEGRGVWIVGDNGRRRRKRGRTTMADVWNLPEEERIEIEVDKYECPCTEEGAVLASFLGVIAKNGRYAPLDIPRWDNKALNSYKEKMLKLVESKFSYPIGTRDWVLASLNKKWRDYKSELKSEYFLPNEKSIHEIMTNVPQDVIEDQWCRMVSEWCTEKSKKLCEANAANSRKQKNNHTSGRKSHARRRKEMEKEHGKEPDRLTFWEITHRKKTGEFVDSDTEKKMDNAREELIAKSQGSEPTNELIEEIFTKHIGPEHNGRVKGLGLGPTPTSYYRLNCWDLPSRNQASSSGEQSREVDKLKGEMKDMREELDRLRALISKRFPEENVGSLSPISGPPINLPVVDHGSANASSPNNRSSNSSHEPSTTCHGRTI